MRHNEHGIDIPLPRGTEYDRQTNELVAFAKGVPSGKDDIPENGRVPAFVLFAKPATCTDDTR